MRSKILWSVIVLIVACLIGVSLFIALAPKPTPNEDYQDYYVRYNGFYSEETEGYVFFYSNSFDMYYEDELTLYTANSDPTFYLYFKSGNIIQPYVQASSELIVTLYHDIDGNYYISVKDIDMVRINPQRIFGGEFDNRG